MSYSSDVKEINKRLDRIEAMIETRHPQSKTTYTNLILEDLSEWIAVRRDKGLSTGLLTRAFDMIIKQRDALEAK